MNEIILNIDEYMYVKNTLRQSIFGKLNGYGCECLGNEELDILIEINKLIDVKLKSKSLEFGGY